MYQLDIFEYEKEQAVRTFEIDGEIWFVAGDVCKVIGLKNVSKALLDLDMEDKTDITGSNVGSKSSKLKAINESGLYSLIFKSKKTEAKKFKKWVTSEVLPQIRKTGAYGVHGSATPAFIKRFNANWDRVDYGYFSVISELAIRLYGRLEQVGYTLPDTGKNGKEIRPDVSVGIIFAKWLKKYRPEKAGCYIKYEHLLPDGNTVQARQYEMGLLSDFIDFVDTVWVRERAIKYFKDRDPKALEFLPRLIPDLHSNKGKSTLMRKTA